MIRIVLLTLLFQLACSVTYSQYKPMLNDGSSWNHYFWFEASCNHRLTINGDSIINGISYKRLLNEGDICNYPFESFYREEIGNKKVYFYYSDTTEIMIYDYSLIVGDTIESTYQYYQFSLKVDSISNVLQQSNICDNITPELNLINPKVFYLSKVNGGFDYQRIWIEGIGNIANPFHPDTPWAQGDLGDALLCHFDSNGFRDYHFIYCQESLPCEGPVVSTKEISSTKFESFVNTSPNPCSKILTIESNKELKEVSVYDISGSLLTQFQTTELTTLDTNKFDSGILIFVFRTVNDEYEIKKIIKE